MARYAGIIGFDVQTEIAPGVWDSQPIERKYFGDINRIRQSNIGNGINNDITISNELSIVADPFATDNFASILYAEYMGVKWKVSSIEVQFPRLILSLGGKYNE